MQNNLWRLSKFFQVGDLCISQNFCLNEETLQQHVAIFISSFVFWQFVSTYIDPQCFGRMCHYGIHMPICLSGWVYKRGTVPACLFTWKRRFLFFTQSAWFHFHAKQPNLKRHKLFLSHTLSPHLQNFAGKDSLLFWYSLCDILREREFEFTGSSAQLNDWEREVFFGNDFLPICEEAWKYAGRFFFQGTLTLPGWP